MVCPAIFWYTTTAAGAATAIPIPARREIKAAQRDYSVLEIDPVARKIVWQYTPHEAGFLGTSWTPAVLARHPNSAQRLPNGNTLICEGSDGRVFEVTAEHEIVWEYICPYKGHISLPMNWVYRAYRLPYSLGTAGGCARRKSHRTAGSQNRVPGAAPFGPVSEVKVEGTIGYYSWHQGTA